MADESVRIGFEVAGIGKAAAEAKELGRDLKAVNAEVDKAAGKAGASKTPSLGRGATPFDRLTAAKSAYERSQDRGNLYRLRVAEQAADRAEKLINPTRPNAMQRLGSVISSSRMNLGGVSPLIGQSLGALAPELGAAAGPLMAAIGGVLLLGRAAQATAGMMGEHVSARWQMAASPGAAGQTAFMGHMMGMSPGETAGNMRGAMERIASDNLARNFAGQYGVRNMGTWDDPTKEPEKYRKLVRAIATDPDEKRAIRAARRFGMEEALKFRDLSPMQREMSLGLGIGDGTSFGKQAERDKNTIDWAGGIAGSVYDSARATALRGILSMLHIPTGPEDTGKQNGGSSPAGGGGLGRRQSEGSYGTAQGYMPGAVAAGGAFAYQNRAWDGGAFTFGAFW